MSLLLEVLSRRNTPEEVRKAFSDYNSYLESIRKTLPSSAYDFAAATWHYNHRDHRCPHDSRVESLIIREPSSGGDQEEREVAIVMRLLGAYQDGLLELSYRRVSSYSLSGEIPEVSKVGHSDWLVDEVRLSSRNLVVHEVLFASGSRWLIECHDIESHWVPRP